LNSTEPQIADLFTPERSLGRFLSPQHPRQRVGRLLLECIVCSSSGLTTTGPAAFAANRQVELAHREHNINDIAVSQGGSVLYCAAGSVVQIWDLRRWGGTL